MRKSINKTTVIIVLAIFLTISVGYALFSDTITIEGTATAQGNFNVDATCVTNLSDKEIEYASKELTIEDNGYKEENCTVLNDELTYSVGLEYPGASKVWLIKFTNTGSIDAKMNLEVLDDGLSNSTVNTYNSQTNALINSEEQRWGGFITNDKPFFQRANGEYVSQDDDGWMEEFYTWDDDYEYFFLSPGASIYVPMKYGWPNKETYSKSGEYYVATQTVSADWMQAVGN